jgi:ribosomal protein L23
MAIQFTDFSRAPLNTQESPLSSVFENVLKGYKMEQEPAKMKQEASARELANQLKKLEVDHKPKQYELDDRGKELANSMKAKANAHYEEKFNLDKQYKEAQIKNLLQKKLGGNVKANGELANFMVSHPDATQEDIRKAYEEIHGKKMDHEQTIIDRSKDVVAGNSFDKLPTNDKKQAVALMKGMDVDPVASVSWLRSGKTPTDYAKEHNIDINTVVPRYSAGEQNIKDAQRVDAYQAEIKSFETHITDGLKKYQNKVNGYSLKQIADAAEGKNTDEQAKALAARALVPELNALRLKIMGGNIGIEALNELKHTSLSELKIIQSLVDTKTYKAAQDYMSKWINEAGTIRSKSLVGNSMLKTDQQKSAKSEAKGAKVLNLATGQWEDE